ncbi:MAG: phosphatidate cytidylyltransferase [Candidatus Omnitrophica bacterium]|nr:phosphatidate cytidylyltransferase [Candidatus Omnitrophota bacterium]
MADSVIKRVITSLTVLSAVFCILFLLPNWAFCILTTFFVAAALYEFFSIVEKKGVVVYKYYGILIGIVIPIAVYFQKGEGYSNMEPLFIVITCLFAFILQLARRDRAQNHLTSIAILLFALFYISWFLSFVIKIKFLHEGAKLVTFLVIVTKGGDVGAYFIGKYFGKHPLIPRISPHKTKEGAIGGLMSCVILALLSKGILVDFPYTRLLFLGFLFGILGQIGDLAESLFKRDFDAKDSSRALPGLGGMLDTIDSLLFTAPIFYFYLNIKNLF